MTMINRSFMSGMLVGGALFGGGMVATTATQSQDEQATETAPHERVITAGRIDLVDENGTVVLALGANDRGGSVSVRDDFGRTVLIAGATDTGGAMVTYGSGDGKAAASVAATPTGGSIQIFEPTTGDVVALMKAAAMSGSMRVGRAGEPGSCELGLSDQGDGQFIATNHEGHTAISLAGDATGGGLIETFAAAGSPQVTLGATTAGHGRIDTFSPNGQPLIALAASEDNHGQLYVFNQDGKRMGAIATNEFGPTFVLFNLFDEPVVTLGSGETGSGEINVLDREKNGRRITP